MLRIDRIGFNRNFFGSQAGSPEAHIKSANASRGRPSCSLNQIQKL
jgi:hypothetical protein